MKAKKISALGSSLILAFSLYGCGKINEISSNRIKSIASVSESESIISASESETTRPITSATDSTTSAATTASTTATAPPETTTTPATDEAAETTAAVTKTEKPTAASVNANSEQYPDYSFSDEYNKFLSETVFVGDSICSGLDLYGILPDNNVIAKGSASANNIFTFDFKLNGTEMPVMDALADLKPKYVVFSMGMNDVNLTTAEVFVNNYNKLLTETKKILPDSKLIVASITPVSATSKFCSNTKIDSYNAAMRDFLDGNPEWLYADVTREIKNESNGLKDGYNGGDGIHLSRSAYYAFLYQVCQDIVDSGVYRN